MKLSDAILAGCKLVPKQLTNGKLIDALWYETNGAQCHAACVLGTAMIALGVPYMSLELLYPNINLGKIVIDNDSGLSREIIAGKIAAGHYCHGKHQ